MSFYIFTAGSIADADQFMDNLYHTRQGDILPRGGQSLTATDAVYDIGSEDFKWDDVFCNNLYVSGSISTNDGTLWGLVGETIITTTSSSIEFTGLNANYYRMEIYYTDINTASSLRMYINGDSASNYGYQEAYGIIISGVGSSIASSRTSSVSYIESVATTRDATTTVTDSFSVIYFDATLNQIRTIIKNEGGNGYYIGGAYAGPVIYKTFLWNNSIDTITSLKFVSSESNNIGSGTTIRIWGRI